MTNRLWAQVTCNQYKEYSVEVFPVGRIKPFKCRTVTQAIRIADGFNRKQAELYDDHRTFDQFIADCNN